ncbi:MAG: AAA family ATPase [Frankiaceae bacterium]|nr:AAA family ATPase [Frankiaceae bacterium]
MLFETLLGSYTFSTLDDDLIVYLFIEAHAERRHGNLLGRDLKRHVPDTVLPDRAVTIQRMDGDTWFCVLAEVDAAVVLLRSWKASGDVVVSAGTSAEAAAIVTEIANRMPEDKPDSKRRVSVSFTDGGGPSRYLKIDVRPWEEVRGLYPGDVQAALDSLVTYRPAAAEARRLMVWRGPAGTGKTTAIRALAAAWRSWADPVVVTDPERLVVDPNYLRRTVLDEQNGGKWQFIILEDAEALLSRATGSDGIGRLLNLSDGLLGQGLRSLFLLTTNQPIASINPAIVRPGRCLANLEFGPLSAAEAASILGRPVSRSMTLAEVMIGDQLQSSDDHVAIGQYL